MEHHSALMQSSSVSMGMTVHGPTSLGLGIVKMNSGVRACRREEIVFAGFRFVRKEDMAAVDIAATDFHLNSKPTSSP